MFHVPKIKVLNLYELIIMLTIVGCFSVFCILDASRERSLILYSLYILGSGTVIFYKFKCSLMFVVLSLISFSFIFIPLNIFFDIRNNIGPSVLALFGTFFCFILAKSLIKDFYFCFRLSRFVFLTYLFFLSVHYFISLQMEVPFTKYANGILLGQSRNIVSFYLIAFQIFYMSACYLLGKKPKLIYIMLTLFFTVMLFGRSGILVSSLLTFIYIFKYYRKSSFLIVLAIMLSQVYLVDFLTENTNFAGGTESPRKTMINEFIDNFDGENLFIGMDIKELPTVVDYSNNIHNSYLNLSVSYGYAIFVLFFGLLFSVFFLFKYEKYLLSLYTCLLLRGVFEVVLFNGYVTDLVFYIFIFSSVAIYQTKKPLRDN